MVLSRTSSRNGVTISCAAVDVRPGHPGAEPLHRLLAAMAALSGATVVSVGVV